MVLEASREVRRGDGEYIENESSGTRNAKLRGGSWEYAALLSKYGCILSIDAVRICCIEIGSFFFVLRRFGFLAARVVGCVSLR